MIAQLDNKPDGSEATSEKERQLELIEQQIADRNLPGADICLRELIRMDPMDSKAFNLFSNLKSLRGELPEAQAAMYRSMQLVQFEDRAGMGQGLERYLASLEASNSRESVISIGSHRFSSLRLETRGNTLLAVGCSVEGNSFLKVLLGSDDEGESRFNRDVAILQHLSDHHCVSSPAVLGNGILERERIGRVIPELAVTGTDSGNCPYVLVEYARADRGGFGLADVLLAILEQRALGIYHDKIALRHIRFDSVTGICRFTGYHDAIELENGEDALSVEDYWQWCLNREAAQSATSKSRFLAGLNSEFSTVTSGERLNLAHTGLFSRQRVASAPEPEVQRVQHSEMILDAPGKELKRLADIPFEPAEKVLQVGCGTGLIARSLAERGCEVTGIDFHCEQVLGAQVLQNISNLDGQFHCKDLDFDNISGEFDTICLFASLHHFWNIEAVTERLSALRPKRIIIETGLNEKGFKWLGRWFQKTPGWSFSDQESFVSWLEHQFPGLELQQEPMPTGSKRRLYVLERSAA
ncbi:MAG: class I SAM-dependent methyltransferase [Puniceicoccaceae bacterium]